ncbi:TBC1 domain family member 2, partial [Phenoliferia sp. Uapishka_3]
PVSLLSRLDQPPPATTTPTPLRGRNDSVSTSRRESITGQSQASEENDDEDEDPAAGYVPLNATNLSSGAQQIVEFGKEEETVEDMGERGREKRRRGRFIDCLGAESVDLTELRKLAWAGIPAELRPMSWQLLLGYLPAPASRRLPTLARKRQEYADAVRLAFSRGVAGLDGPIWHQISIDVPRTNPGVRLWQGQATQRSLERILYVWAIRHPASGYVQGINDLVTPFFEVFLSSYITDDPETYDVSALPPSVLEALEADSFWCLSKLLDGIQDNYIFAQPGIVRQVARMKELCSRVDAPLAYHLEENNVEFMQFAFRWVNCLLMREMSVVNIIRMWDTYLAEGADAFSEFHLYVCLAFLVKWSEPLRGMDFQSIIMFLQSLPTQDWSDKNTELLLSEAFMWSRTFEAR